MNHPNRLASTQKTYDMDQSHQKVNQTEKTKVECGSDHTLALTREGLLYVWGKNDDGQLGIGNSVNYVFCPIPASADVELIVDEKSLYVHKIVIMVYCPEMYKKFFCNRQHETDNVIIRDDFCFATYRSYLKYLYTDVIVLSPKLTLELHDLAMCYDDLIFKAVYIMKIKEEINMLNVFEFYAKAILWQIKDLEEFCFKYAINNLSIVVKTEGYANLSEKIRFDFIIKAADAQAFRH